MQERDGGGVMLAAGTEGALVDDKKVLGAVEEGGAVKMPSSPWLPSMSSKVGQADPAAATMVSSQLVAHVPRLIYGKGYVYLGGRI